MTNEEAKELLSKITSFCDFTDEYGDYINDEPYHEAIDLAIKALEQTDLESYSDKLWRNAYERGKAEQMTHLTDRPCSVCEFHTDKGCSKWGCVFEGSEGIK